MNQSDFGIEIINTETIKRAINANSNNQESNIGTGHFHSRNVSVLSDACLKININFKIQRRETIVKLKKDN